VTDTESEETAGIRAEIDRTRQDMSRTAGALEERLSPAHIKEQAADVKQAALDQFHEAKNEIKDDIAREIRQAKSAVRDATVGRVEHMVEDVRESVSDMGTGIRETIRANPIPAAMIGLGLGWLLMSNSRRRRSYDREWVGPGYRRGGRSLTRGVKQGASQLVDQAEGVAHDVGEKAQELAHEARERAVHAVDDARDTGRRVARRAETTLRQAEWSVENTLRDNPLAAGAIALAVGAAIGLALPHTRSEDEWMGQAKEKLLDRGKGVADNALENVEQKVDELTSSTKPQEDSPTSGPPSNGIVTTQYT